MSEVISQAINLLKPGGLIIIRENLLTENRDQTIPPMFTAEELNIQLENNSDIKPIYYSHLGDERDFSEIQNSSMVYAVIQKGG